MSGTAGVLSLVGESDRTMFAMAPWASTSTSRRVPTAEQLMAPECGVVLPRLNEVPVEHRFLADDRETIRLAEILVTLGIGAVEDWSQSRKGSHQVRVADSPAVDPQSWRGCHRPPL